MKTIDRHGGLSGLITLAVHSLLSSAAAFFFLGGGTCANAEETNTVSNTDQPSASVKKEDSNPNIFYIDRMDTTKNLLGGRCAPYQKPPSKLMMTKGADYGHDGAGLKLSYKQVNVGGPYGQGGWCGYYTVLKKGDKYFNASNFTHLTFWVRGEQGEEHFKVGIADKQYGMIEDSVKSKPIDAYLPDKKITTQWQKAVIPIGDMFVDYNLVDTISINFEADLFESEETAGTIYVDDLAFEKLGGPEDEKKPADAEQK